MHGNAEVPERPAHSGDQRRDDVTNRFVGATRSQALGFAERKASLDEALRGVPGLTVQNRRDYGLTGGIALSVRAPPSEPLLGIRGLAVIQDGIPLTTTDGTTEPGNVDLGAGRCGASRSSAARARSSTATPPAG